MQDDKTKIGDAIVVADGPFRGGKYVVVKCPDDSTRGYVPDYMWVRKLDKNGKAWGHIIYFTRLVRYKKIALLPCSDVTKIKATPQQLVTDDFLKKQRDDNLRDIFG